MRFLLLLLALPVMAQECVPFIDNSAYCRQGVTAWYLRADTNDWPLFLNGVDQNSPDIGGPASIDWIYAQPKRTVKVGIADSAHGIALDFITTNCAPGVSIYHSTPDAAGLRDIISNGCHVALCSWFTTIQGQPANDLSNACYEASQAGVIVVCSVPNANQSIDTTEALPASLHIPLLIPVTSITRQDLVFSPAATGSNVIAAPGRVILTQDVNGNPVYASGTSYAAPMVAGVAAWLMEQFDQSPSTIVQAIKNGLVPIDPRILGRLSLSGAVQALRPFLDFAGVAHGIGQYGIEYSDDLIEWTTTEPCDPDQNCFIRAKVL